MLRGGGDRAITLLELASNIHDARIDDEHVLLTRNRTRGTETNSGRSGWS